MYLYGLFLAAIAGLWFFARHWRHPIVRLALALDVLLLLGVAYVVVGWQWSWRRMDEAECPWGGARAFVDQSGGTFFGRFEFHARVEIRDLSTDAVLFREIWWDYDVTSSPFGHDLRIEWVAPDRLEVFWLKRNGRRMVVGKAELPLR